MYVTYIYTADHAFLLVSASHDLPNAHAGSGSMAKKVWPLILQDHMIEYRFILSQTYYYLRNLNITLKKSLP